MKKLIVFIVLCMFAAKGYCQYNKRYFYYTAQRAMSAGDFRKAINLMSVLIETDNKNFEALFIRAIGKYNINDLAGAERDLSNAIYYNSGYAQAYQYRAIVRAMRGNYKDALKDFKSAIKLRPDFTDVYYSRGVTYFLNQQFDKAIKDFSHCLRINPEMVDAYINRGSAHLLSKDTLAALKDYDKAIEFDYRNSNVYVRRGSIYAQMKKYDLAFDNFNKAISFDTLSIPAYFNRALTNAQAFKYKEAVNDFSKVIEIDPKNSLTFFNRAILYSQIGDYKKALEDYDKVVELTPNNVLGVYNRGMLNAKLGNLVSALSDYTTAIELYPDFANAYLNRSNVKYMLEDMEGSKRDNEIAKEKIQAYKSRMDQISFDKMVDTSKVMNKLLSFDMDFGNSEFEGVQGKKFDIRQLPQYRMSFAEKPEALTLNRKYSNRSLNNLLQDYGKKLVYTNKDLNIKENVLLTKLSRPENAYSFSEAEIWKAYAFEGILQSSMRQYANAVDMFSRAIYAHPHSAYLYANRAVAYSEMTEFISNIDTKTQKLVVGVDKSQELKTSKTLYSYEQALEDINRAIEIEPNVAYFYYNRAVIKCLKGDMTGAIDDYSNALELYPNFAEALYNRGMIQLYIKETQKGFLDISRASDLNLKDAYEVLESFGKMLEKKN